MAKSTEQSIIIKKVKKGGHGGHHGGSWKVAYADFVTAMMAFFLVMWIVGMNKDIKEAIAGYFKDPVGFMKAVNGGKKPFGEQNLPGHGAPAVRPDMKPPADTSPGINEEKAKFMMAKAAMEKLVQQCPEFKSLKDSIKIRIADEGLRIDLLESSSDMFFDSGSANMKPRTKDLLVKMASELGKLSNDIVLEGHTDSRPFNGRNGWTNWELSTARANAARSVMSSAGLRHRQIIEVRGLADTMPLDKKHVDSFKNRRVSILLPFRHIPRRTVGLSDIRVAPPS